MAPGQGRLESPSATVLASLSSALGTSSVHTRTSGQAFKTLMHVTVQRDPHGIFQRAGPTRRQSCTPFLSAMLGSQL